MPEKKGWWGAKWLDPTNPERDTKLGMFMLGVVATIYWLTKEQARGAITQEWVDALKWFLAAISLGGAGWAAVDKWRSNATQIPPPPGGEGKDGDQ